MLDIEGLAKSFGGIKAVDGVDLKLRRGETLGVLGPNGSGKTTLFDLISGYLRPDAGRVRFNGTDITAWSADRRARAGLGRSFQDARLFPSLTVAQNLALSLDRHLWVHDHIAFMLGLPGARALEEDLAWSVGDLIDLMNLGAFRDKFVRELSTGSRVVVSLAMSLAHDPSALLLDEPSAGLAQRETEALGPLLARLQDETGCALLLIEHDIPLVTSVAGAMVALVQGRSIAQGSPAAVMANPEVVRSYFGGESAATMRTGAAERSGSRRERRPLVAAGRTARG